MMWGEAWAHPHAHYTSTQCKRLKQKSENVQRRHIIHCPHPCVRLPSDTRHLTRPARVRTYVCEGWVGAYPHPTPYPPTPLYPLYCKGVIYPPTPLVGKVRTTCNTIPQTMVRYACVTTAAVKPPQATDAPACHSCRGKPRQAPSGHRNLAAPTLVVEMENFETRCRLSPIARLRTW